MSNKINNVYIFSDEEIQTIEDNFLIHTDWDKPAFANLKSNIRDFLRPEQTNLCCYCKKELGFDIKAVDIEHIIPKATYPKFTFEPLNLALSCPACNTIKGDKNVLSKKIVKYPKDSKKITIIHSHFDNYDLHIMIHDGCIYEALTKKGSHTITICELFRLKTVESKARIALSNKSSNGDLVNYIINAPKEELGRAMVELSRRIK